MDNYRYTYRGLTFGELCDVAVAEVDGLAGYETRSGDQEMPRGHGAIAGPQYVTARQILFHLWIHDNHAEVETLLAEVREAFAATGESDELVFARPGMPERMVRCRPAAITRTETPLGTTVARPSVVLVAHDPRIYSAVEHSTLVPIYTPSGGVLNYPVNYAKNWSAGTVAEAVVDNAGSADAYPLVRFYGPTVGTVESVTLANLTTGETLTISADILTGQVLYFDGTAWVTANGDQVVHIDGASRYGDWEQPHIPLSLAPGSNVLRFTLDGTSTDARCLVTWRSTWLS